MQRRRALKTGLWACVKKEGAQKRVRILPFPGQTGPNLDLTMAYGQSSDPYLKNEPILVSLLGLGAEKHVFEFIFILLSTVYQYYSSSAH